MSLEQVADFPNRLPVRVRAGVALGLLWCMRGGVSKRHGIAIDEFVEMAWSWVSQSVVELGAIYRVLLTSEWVEPNAISEGEASA